MPGPRLGVHEALAHRAQEARAVRLADGDAARRRDVQVGGGRRERLGERGIRATVDDPEGLAHPVLDGKRPGRAPSLCLEQLEAESLVQRPASGRVRPPVRSPGAALSFAARGHLRPALRRAAGDHRARAPAWQGLRAARRACSAAGAARARARARGAVRPGSAQRPRRRGGVARAGRRLRPRSSRAAPRPTPRAATCAAPRPRARGPARFWTRWSSSTRTAPMPAIPEGRAPGGRSRRPEAPGAGGPARATRT